MAPIAMTFAAAAAAAGPCDSPEHRAFDFWRGEWQVYGPKGKLAGTNSITPEHGGCVLHERYATGQGYRGESLNAYDAGRKVWHQTWVDNGGLLLLLEGGIQGGSMVMQGGSMVLQGSTTAADGAVTRHRITWTPNADGTVRQFWESTDRTGQWTVTFDGKYVRRGS